MLQPLSNFPCICICFWMSLSLMVEIPKEERKLVWEEIIQPWKSLKLELDGLATIGGWTATVAAPSLFVPLRSEVAISDWSTHPNIWRTRVLFAHVGCHKLCQAISGTYAQLLISEQKWRMGCCYPAKSWNWQKLTTVYCSNLLLKLQVFNIQ